VSQPLLTAQGKATALVLIIVDGKDPEDFLTKALGSEELFRKLDVNGSPQYYASARGPNAAWTVIGRAAESEVQAGT
jgi:hypothetical protein